MRVGFVSAFPVFAALGGGGAEMSDYAMIREGFKRDHQIQQVLNLEAMAMGGFDCLILANYRTNRGEPVWSMPLLIEGVQKTPTIIYNHDIPMCHHQLWYPAAERCKTCPNGDRTRALLESAVLNVFLSPLHVRRLAETQPWIDDLARFLTPSPIDVKFYRDRNSLRVPGTVLGINSLTPLKGGPKVLEYVKEHPELQFAFVGESAYPQAGLPKNATWLGPRPPAQMPDLFSQHDIFLHLPPSLDPFSRSITEARLCGIKKFVRNDNIGACSYNEWRLNDQTFRDWIAGAPRRFWEAVEQAVGI